MELESVSDMSEQVCFPFCSVCACLFVFYLFLIFLLCGSLYTFYFVAAFLCRIFVCVCDCIAFPNPP